MCKIRSGELYGEHTFQLRSSATEVAVHKGLYAITDGGYHAWRSLQFPLKSSALLQNMRWSKRLESVRKVSECAFGISKMQFKILRVGFTFRDRTENPIKCDNTFKVCAMLYNHWLRHRNLHTIGESVTDWERATTDLDDDRIEAQSSYIFGQVQQTSTNHWVDDERVGNDTVQEVEDDHHKLTEALIAHYTYEFEDKHILWPKSALQLRGRVDHRPLEPGGVVLMEGEERHAYISDSDSDSDESD
jgi:hypothetical protein